jgi:hypothetical protein
MQLARLPDGIFSNQKIPIWVNFGGSKIGRCWYILRTCGLFHGHLIYLVDFNVIWYIFPVLVCCIKSEPVKPMTLFKFISVSNQKETTNSKFAQPEFNDPFGGQFI